METKDCVLPLVVRSKDEDEREANRRNADNRHLIKMLAWIEKNGRRIDAPAGSLSQEYVQLHAISASLGFDTASEGVLDTSGQTDWDTAPPPNGDAMSKMTVPGNGMVDSLAQ